MHQTRKHSESASLHQIVILKFCWKWYCMPKLLLVNQYLLDCQIRWLS